MCYAKLLHGHVVQFPPIRAEDVFNDITIHCKGTKGLFQAISVILWHIFS